MFNKGNHFCFGFLPDYGCTCYTDRKGRHGKRYTVRSPQKECQHLSSREFGTENLNLFTAYGYSYLY